jgi:hypothetical protein
MLILSASHLVMLVLASEMLIRGLRLDREVSSGAQGSELTVSALCGNMTARFAARIVLLQVVTFRKRIESVFIQSFQPHDQR